MLEIGKKITIKNLIKLISKDLIMKRKVKFDLTDKTF